jgi:hypothetical protein
MGEAHSSAPRRASAECPIACRRNQEKNAGETRGQGSLSRWPYLGWGQPVEGAAARERPALPCSPPRSLHPGCLVRERPESGGIGCCLRPTPTLRPHCPIYSSSDSTASGNTDSRPINGKSPCKTRQHFFWCLEGATRTAPAMGRVGLRSLTMRALHRVWAAISSRHRRHVSRVW